jgi:hypothetical protein
MVYYGIPSFFTEAISMARRGGLESPILELCITAKPYYNGIYPEFPAGGEMDFDDIEYNQSEMRSSEV